MQGGGSGLGTILYPGSDTDAFNGSPRGDGLEKRLLGIRNGGHLNVSDLCNKNDKGSSELRNRTACAASRASSRSRTAASIDPAKGVAITNAATTAVLEETLQCQDRAATITGLKTKYPGIDVFKEQ